MLRELVIRNFAIIDELELGLGPGLTCLTGETGAGKSILVDALGFILGGRPGPGVAEDGRETTVEAMFDVSGAPGAAAVLEELGLEAGDELVLRRVASSGRGRAYVNGSMANIATLQRIGDGLVDIHGQHEHQSLLRVERHLGLLDEYCGAGAEKADYRTLFDGAAAYEKRLSELVAGERERAQRVDLLRFQVSEIDAAGLSLGEDEALVSERARLANADRLRALAYDALERLREQEPSALTLLADATRSASDIAAVTPEMAEAVKLIENAAISAGEACSILRDFAGTLDADPERLEEVEDRLALISSLRKKYGDDIGEVLDYRERASEELASLGNADGEAEDIRAALEGVREELSSSGGRLTALRREGAVRFARKVNAELGPLGMPKAVFDIAFHTLERPGPSGLERAEFLFSANPGMRPMPLARIASGGELSRVMLALKVVLSTSDTVPTLVFDEVDSGVGGVTAGSVGRKLREAARGRQVLCVTHLPQIAALASEHLSVVKDVSTRRTVVTVERLGKDGRVAELARMLGGDEGSKTASAHAEELVRQGEEYV